MKFNFFKNQINSLIKPLIIVLYILSLLVFFKPLSYLSLFIKYCTILFLILSLLLFLNLFFNKDRKEVYFISFILSFFSIFYSFISILDMSLNFYLFGIGSLFRILMTLFFTPFTNFLLFYIGLTNFNLYKLFINTNQFLNTLT